MALTAVAEKTSPAFFTNALPGLLASTVLAVGILLALVTVGSSPAGSTAALVRTNAITLAMLTSATNSCEKKERKC